MKHLLEFTQRQTNFQINRDEYIIHFFFQFSQIHVGYCSCSEYKNDSYYVEPLTQHTMAKLKTVWGIYRNTSAATFSICALCRLLNNTRSSFNSRLLPMVSVGSHRFRRHLIILQTSCMMLTL